jgi:hypothetical protein
MFNEDHRSVSGDIGALMSIAALGLSIAAIIANFAGWWPI